MTDPISWKRANVILERKDALLFLVKTDIAAVETLKRNLCGFWSFLPDPQGFKVIVEDQTDIDFVVRHFVKERLGKRNIPLGRINARTSASNFAKVIR